MPRKKRSQSRPASKQQALGRSSSIGDLGSRRIRPSGFSYIRIWKVPVGQTGTFRYWKLWKEKKGNKKSWIVFSFFDQRLSLTTISIRSLPKMRVKREFLFIRHRHTRMGGPGVLCKLLRKRKEKNYDWKNYYYWKSAALISTVLS